MSNQNSIALGLKSIFNPKQYGEEVFKENTINRDFIFINILLYLLCGVILGFILDNEGLIGINFIPLIGLGLMILFPLSLVTKLLYNGSLSYFALKVMKANKTYKKTLIDFSKIYNIQIFVSMIIITIFGAFTYFLYKISDLGFIITLVILTFIFVPFFIYLGIIYIPYLIHKEYKISLGDAFLAGLVFYGFNVAVSFILQMLFYVLMIFIVIIAAAMGI